MKSTAQRQDSQAVRWARALSTAREWGITSGRGVATLLTVNPISKAVACSTPAITWPLRPWPRKKSDGTWIRSGAHKPARLGWPLEGAGPWSPGNAAGAVLLDSASRTAAPWPCTRGRKEHLTRAAAPPPTQAISQRLETEATTQSHKEATPPYGSNSCGRAVEPRPCLRPQQGLRDLEQR